MPPEELDRLLQAVMAQARALDIPLSAAICPRVAVNARATTRFGCCTLRGGQFTVELSAQLLPAGEAACRQTLAHELLHTCPDCHNHGARWKHYAAQMNAAYGYQIARTGSYAALGLAERAPRYLLVCTRCGREFKRAKASRLVQHPECYRCACGGALKLAF